MMGLNYIDFHAHILPRVDHGSDNKEVSIMQLALAKKAGVGHIVATPHFYPGKHSAPLFLESRDKAFSELNDALNDITVTKGAEVLLCEGLQNLPELDRLCIGTSNAIMIEMPGPPWTKRLIETLEKIEHERGLIIILAHVDRYDSGSVEELFSMGLRGQLNAIALGSPLMRRRLFRWIDEGAVIALGSDIHGTGRAYKEYAHAMRVLGKRGEMLQNRMQALVFEKPCQ